MKIAFYSTKPYDREYFDQENTHHRHEITYFAARLDPHTAVLAKGYNAICCFVNDHLDRNMLATLTKLGVKLIALRAAGYNNVDVKAASRLKMPVVRVPDYSPYAVAEHAVALIMTLNRKIHRAVMRVKLSDFSLHGLMGFDLHGKTVGVVGTGKIGSVFAHIMRGFGCRILAHDKVENVFCRTIGVKYVDIDQLLKFSDVISLHCPLFPDTFHIIDQKAFEKMKKGAMLINTSRGALIDATAAIEALKDKKLGALGLDVYEEEEHLFFEDLSDQIIQDDVFARLQTFPNVVITSHQAYFTQEAMEKIAKITMDNVTAFEKGEIQNAVTK